MRPDPNSPWTVAVPALIYLVLPALGLALYLRVSREWRAVAPAGGAVPTSQLFLVFVGFGGLLQLALTVLFWEWSGAASLGVAFLLFVLVPETIGYAVVRVRTRTQSPAHAAVWRASVALPLVTLTALLLGLRVAG